MIEATGHIKRLSRRGRAARIVVAAPFASELERGESVALNGVCLTVARADRVSFEVDAVERTMATTTLGRASAGRTVNLERAVRAGDRLGGHLVTGHVDGIGRVVRVERTPTGRDVTIEIPDALARHVAARGSIAVDGVSLTVARVEGRRFSVSLIPETLTSTTASSYRAGSTVNVETDVLAKYQESIGAAEGAAGEQEAGTGRGLTAERLRDLGFTE